MGPKTPVAPPHPHVTVDDVWHGALPEGTQLVAGNAGTRREVVWCTTLLARLHELTGVPVVLERDSGLDYVGGGRLAESAAALIAQERPALEEWLREVPLSAFDPPVALRPLAQGQARLIAPILVQGSIAGFLSLLGSDGELGEIDRKSTRLNSSHLVISYAVF